MDHFFRTAYSPQFSGHETFPLRYGWLKKAFDRVADTEHQPENRSACWGEDAIARFGVGKNMVASMRHWAKVSGVIEEPTTNSVRTTELGRLLFGSAGLDPYMEHPATLWLTHWRLAARDEKTTWFWAFNHYPAVTFERASLINRLDRLAMDRQWSRVANTTIRNDVACFIRTYVARQPSVKAGHDDALESPLTELGLIKAIGQKGRIPVRPRTEDHLGRWCLHLCALWTSGRDIPMPPLCHSKPSHMHPAARARIPFRREAMSPIVSPPSTVATDGALQWSETAGIKQVERHIDIGDESDLSWIRNDYGALTRKEAA